LILDKRKFNGGNKNAGRKPKADEIKLIEQMDSILAPDDVWIKVADLVLTGDIHAMKLWIEYRYGKAKQSIDHTAGGEPMPCPVIVFPKDEQV
jgi:hypothetical protein